MSDEFREKFVDSRGKGIVYNWFVIDHVGFETNERHRDMGYGNVFKFYRRKIKEFGNKDKIYFHFHPISFSKEAHIPATSFDNSMYYLLQVLVRRLIDFNWFPVAYRAGFHTIRQDSNLFLERWIPFDYSNQATYENEKTFQIDISNGRFGDWRRAPKEWKPYHPDIKDYQSKGSMNRWITKCLNIGTRLRLLTDLEIRKAFELAEKEGKAILAFTNHDFRDMRLDIIDVYSRIWNISKEFPDVKLYNCDAVEAMQRYFYTENEIIWNKLNLSFKWEKGVNYDRLIIETMNGEVFGSQPFLAIKTKDGRYLHDNFDEYNKKNSWSYTFDKLTLKLKQIESIKVASNDKYGNQFVIDVKIENFSTKHNN